MFSISFAFYQIFATRRGSQKKFGPPYIQSNVTCETLYIVINENNEWVLGSVYCLISWYYCILAVRYNGALCRMCTYRWMLKMILLGHTVRPLVSMPVLELCIMYPKGMLHKGPEQ